MNLVGFDINSSEPTNNNLIVTYTSNKNETYIYNVYKDEKIIETGLVTNEDKVFLLNDTGIYKIEIINQNSLETLESGEYIIDKISPVIKAKSITVTEGNKIDVLKNVTVSDNYDNNLEIKTNIDELSKEAGKQKLTYTVVDSAGNITTKEVDLIINPDNTMKNTLIFGGIIIILTIFAYLYSKYQEALKLKNRFKKFSIDSIRTDRVSMYDRIKKLYLNAINKISNIIKKSEVLPKAGQRYEKYVMILNKDFKEGIDYVSNKIIISFLILLLSLFTEMLKLNYISLYEIIIPVIFGYILPDVVYFIKFGVHRKQVENDLLQAIVIMNNAFKSGRSIIQAIELVSNELSGEIGKEFKKMHKEIMMGLDIEEVFKRFSKRIKIDEITYLTASLSILNRSGGNITKVFSSIEKSLFNKKKLRLELNSLTGSSKIITIVLSSVPILFILFISLVNNEYFLPLINTKIGRIITGGMLIYYVLYIYFVRKIMKVRM